MEVELEVYSFCPPERKTEGLINFIEVFHIPIRSFLKKNQSQVLAGFPRSLENLNCHGKVMEHETFAKSHGIL